MSKALLGVIRGFDKNAINNNNSDKKCIKNNIILDITRLSGISLKINNGNTVKRVLKVCIIGIASFNNFTIISKPTSFHHSNTPQQNGRAYHFITSTQNNI